MPVLGLQTLVGLAGASGFGLSGATVAEYSHVQLWNPGPGLLWVYWFGFVTTTASSNTVSGLYTHGTALTTLADGAARWADRRLSGNPIGQIRTQANAAQQKDANPALHRAFMGTNAPREFEREIIVPVDTGIVFIPDITNTEIRVGFNWAEQPPL